jgi:beta-carotene 15,15'-dioxygenase
VNFKRNSNFTADSSERRFSFYQTVSLSSSKHFTGKRNRLFSLLLQFFTQSTSIEAHSKANELGIFRPLVLLLLAVILVILGNGTTAQNYFAYSLFFLGLITVGIPHGAVDHLLETGAWNFKKAPSFIFKYLLISALMAGVWYILPPLALFIFLTYSSWHFGEADGKQWHFSPALSFIWGVSVLFYILGTHPEETNSILASMGNATLTFSCSVWAILPWLLFAVYKKNYSFAITIVWLIVSSKIPLLFAFGLYFIGQHSLNGWKHIQSHLKISHKKIWLHSLPFHAGAWMLLAAFFFLWPSKVADRDLNHWGSFFIFIACISLPHAITMRVVYKQKPNIE